MSAEQVAAGDDRAAAAWRAFVDDDGQSVRYVPSHRRAGRPEPVAPAALGLLAVVLAAVGGGVLVGLLLSAVLT